MNLKRKIIARNHPHYGEIGILDLNDSIASTQQVRLDFVDCKHGVTSCYVTKYEIVGV